MKTAKVAIVGGNFSGKTCLCKILTTGKYPSSKPKSNFGTFFYKRIYKKPNLKIQYLDTAGFKSITNYNRDTMDLYYDADLIVAVYSVDTNTFPQIEMLLKDMKENCDNPKYIFICCNKIDIKMLNNETSKLFQLGQNLKKKDKLVTEFFPISCKDNLNVDQVEKAILKYAKKVAK